MNHRTLIAIATYNEMENLPRLVDEIFTVCPEADLLIVDDNSPDGTGQWCDEKAAQDTRLRCLHREGKLGLGTAAIAGFAYAIENDYDVLVNLDADFSHHPRYLPQLLGRYASEEPVDVVIGSRYTKGGGVKGWPLSRRMMSRCVNLYGRCLLGLPVNDISGSFRCYRVDLLRKLDLKQIHSRGYSFYEEILWRLKRVGARFAEVPIEFVDREFGQSKINSREAVAALLILFRLGVKNWLRF